MNKLLLILLVVIFFSCNKNDVAIIEETPLTIVGEWQLTRMHWEAYDVNNTKSEAEVLQINDAKMIFLDEDSSFQTFGSLDLLLTSELPNSSPFLHTDNFSNVIPSGKWYIENNQLILKRHNNTKVLDLLEFNQNSLKFSGNYSEVPVVGMPSYYYIEMDFER